MSAGFLSRVPLFAALGDRELEQLLESTTTVAVPAGTYLFRRGEQGDALYIVEEGLLDAVIDEGTSAERTLGTFAAGEFFGEMALLTREPRSASVRALADSRLIKLSHDRFSLLLERTPAMALHLSKVLSTYLARTNAHLSRGAARISAVVPAADPASANALAPALLASLERQFGAQAVMIMLGEPAVPDAEEAGADDLSRIARHVRPLPSGGGYLYFGGEALDRMDDLAMLSVINSLRVTCGHVVVWTGRPETVKRLASLTRIDQTFLIAGYPYDEARLGRLAGELAEPLPTGLRFAYIAPLGRPAPPVPPGSRPPMRLAAVPGTSATSQEGVDRLARALAGMTVGLALGSGTAQGLAHMGVMKALIEAGIPIDLIAGTSGGALYGSMVACGMTIEESVGRVIRETRRNLIDKLDFAIPTRGLIRGARIERMVQSVIGDVSFDDLPIPLCAVAADLDSGEEILLNEGPVYRAVRASISVPGIFEPYALDGRILVDGVVVNPLPVSVARSMGADIVVAVQVPAPGKVNMENRAGAKGGRRKNDFSILASIVRSHHFVGDRLADKTASEADVFVKPDVTRFGWREYRAAPEIIEAGYRAGLGAVRQVSELLWGSSRENSAAMER